MNTNLTLNRVCFVIALILFVLSALPVGASYPLVAIGLAFMAAGHLL